ncbi:MAG: hypothetical protein ACPGRX_00850 [Bdellovibrionales bacterium]
MVKGFNAESEKPVFIYKPHPAVDGAFEIHGFFTDVQDYEPVGEYRPVVKGEPKELTEGCVSNLTALLNDRKEKMINLENMRSGRLLFQIVENDNNDAEENKYITIMFRTHDGMGVSEENAVFKLEKGVFYARFIEK